VPVSDTATSSMQLPAWQLASNCSEANTASTAASAAAVQANHSLLDLLCQGQQMHIAGVSFIPHRTDAHLGLAHILLLQA